MSDYDVLGKPVAVNAIETELHQLWAADDASTNASLMNLVVYSEKAGSLVTNSEVVRELTREHACRAILVELDRGQEGHETETYITAHCHMLGGKKSVCCEQIAFRMLGRAHGRLTNMVFAHTASDLPMIFWWQGEFSTVFSDRLTAVVDRLLIDSSTFSDLKSSHERLREAMEEEGQHFIVQDLAWTRTYQFRVVFAKLFDDPCAQSSLPDISALKITTHPDHQVSGLLMLSWIAVQAGWSLKGTLEGGIEISGADGQSIGLTLETCEKSAALGAVELKGEDFSMTLDRCADEELIREKLCCGNHCVEGVSPADAVEAGDLVASQLSRGGRNRLYRKTLPVFRALL